MGALLRYIIGRRLPLLIGSVIVTVLVIVSARLLPFDWFCYLWALAAVGGVILATRYDLGEDAE